MKEANFIASIIILSILFQIALIKPGFFTVDERGYLYLTRSIAEKGSLDVSPNIYGYTLIKSDLILPTPFIFSPCGIGICTQYSFGFPLLVFPFHVLLGDTGVIIFNVILNTLSTLLVYLIAKKIWRDINIAVISSVLYLFATDSIFYGISYWYHTLIVASFLMCTYSLLSYSENKRWPLPLFIVASAICVWTGNFMLAPILVMFIYLLIRVRACKVDVIALIVLFGLVQLLSFAYNQYLYSSIYPYNVGGVLFKGILYQHLDIGLAGKLMLTFKKLFYSFFGMIIFRFLTASKYTYFAFYQKAILQYCPYLILTVSGILLLRKIKGVSNEVKIILISTVGYAIMILLGKSSTYGGWELSMRYLLPVIPLLVVLVSGFIHKFLKPRHVIYIVVFSLAISYLLPTMMFNQAYYIASTLSVLFALCTAIVLLFRALRIFYSKTFINPLLTVMLIMMISASVFINTNDVKIGRDFRGFTARISEGIVKNTENNSIILYPRGFPQDISETPGRIRVWYEPKVFLASKDFKNQTYVEEINETIHPFVGKYKLYLVTPPYNMNGSVGLIDAFPWDGVINVSTYLAE